MTETHALARILHGAPLRDELLRQVKQAVPLLPQPPRLAIVQVGDNPASSAYVRNKLLACQRVGIAAEHVHLPATESETSFHTVVRGLAADPQINAVIVQTPLPDGWRVQDALDLVPAPKDIDGLSRASMGLRRAGSPEALLPATPLGVLRLLEYLRIPPAGQRIAVIGRGMVVGAPLREMLDALGADVVAIDKDTPHPATLCRSADTVVAATGVPGLVAREWIKPGATVIDVGLTRTNGRLLGDVDRAQVEDIAAVLTPVPGGVGPMTVACLLTNIVDACLLQTGRPKGVWRLAQA